MKTLIVNNTEQGKLVTQLSMLSFNTLVTQEPDFLGDYTGELYVDTLLHSGNNKSRFFKIRSENGKLIPDSREQVDIVRQQPIRIFSNDLLRGHTDLIRYSILTRPQKELLLKGVSI